MIKTAIRCSDGMVMVFDEKGEQIPEYQGQYENVRESIFKAASPDTTFKHLADTEPRITETSRNNW